MKILLVDLWRVINSMGGTEKVFFSMANALADRGYNVTAVGLDNTVGKPFFPVHANVKFINVGIGYKERKDIFFRIKRALHGSWDARHLYEEKVFDKGKADRLKPVIESENPDLVISYNIEATRILINSLKIKVPVITMFHYDPDTILSKASKASKEALEKSSFIQVLLPSHIEITKQYINNPNIICIPNAVLQYLLSDNDKKENIIINIARIDGVQKRQHLLIEAFAELKTKYPEWKIEIWGEKNYDSKYYQKCVKLINKSNLSKQVFFLRSDRLRLREA